MGNNDQKTNKNKPQNGNKRYHGKGKGKNKRWSKKKNSATFDPNSVAKSEKKGNTKAAGLKSTFVLPNGELLMTSFGRGNDAVLEKRISNVINVESLADGISMFNVNATKNEAEKGIYQISSNRRPVPITGYAYISPDAASRKGQVRMKDELEMEYFGRTFDDNVHIQLIYAILDIKKILSVHTTNIVYTINNLTGTELIGDTADDGDFLGADMQGLRLTYEEFKERNIRGSYDRFLALYNSPRLVYFYNAFFDKDGHKRHEKDVFYILSFLSALRNSCVHASDENKTIAFSADSILSASDDAVMLLDEVNGIKGNTSRANVKAEIVRVLDVLYEERIRSLDNYIALNSENGNLGILFKSLPMLNQNKIAVDFYRFAVLQESKNAGFSITKLREKVVDFYGYNHKETNLRDDKYNEVRRQLYLIIDFIIWEYLVGNINNNKLLTKLVNNLRGAISSTDEEKDIIYSKFGKNLYYAAEETLEKAIVQIIDTDNRGNLLLSDNKQQSLQYALNNAKYENGRSIILSTDACFFAKVVYLLTLFIDGKEINDLITSLINRFDNVASFLDVIDKAGLSENTSFRRYYVDTQKNGNSFANQIRHIYYVVDYTVFSNSSDIALDLRRVNSFARMYKFPNTREVYQQLITDATRLLGINATNDDIKAITEWAIATEGEKGNDPTKESVENNIATQEAIEKAVENGDTSRVALEELKKLVDSGKFSEEFYAQVRETRLNRRVRNFVVNNLIHSARFKYIVRYGDVASLSTLLKSNSAIIRFILDELPEKQVNRFYDAVSKQEVAQAGKKDFLTKLLQDMDFKQFYPTDEEISKDGVKAALTDERKAMLQSVMSLYLHIMYQLVKNMVYINSRYIMACHCLERDTLLKIPNTNYEAYDDFDYGFLYQKSVSDAEHFSKMPYTALLTDVCHRPVQDSSNIEEVRAAGWNFSCRAYDYVGTNLSHVTPDDVVTVDILREYRNAIAHLEVLRRMAVAAVDVKIAKPQKDKNGKVVAPNQNHYFMLYHYIMQKKLLEAASYGDGERIHINDYIDSYFERMQKSHLLCRDFVWALNVPFAYNLTRYKNLSTEGLFDMNRPGMDDWKKGKTSTEQKSES